MRLSGPAEEGSYGGYPTAPLPAVGSGHWQWIEDDPYSGNGRPPGGAGGRPGRPGYPRPRRRFRWLRRLLTLVVGLGVLGILALGGLLLVTPSVSSAQAVARSIDLAHHAAYPGPPVPARFSESLVATEDHFFYYEPGIDPLAVGRVVLGKLTGTPDQGGATLYQQLAKMLYTPGNTSTTAKAEEVGLGIKLYLTYSKALILQMYADVTYFGHNYYGLEQASCGYFGVQPAQLSWPQAATLAGIVQLPSLDDPLAHYANARAREAHVLGRLAAAGTMTQAQASAEYARPLHLIPGGGHCAGSG